MNPRYVVLAAASLVACGGSPHAAVTPAAARAADAGAVAAAPAASEDDADVPIAADDATWGNRLAPVTIVAFESFQCPFCAKTAPTIAKLQSEYGPDQLRVVFKNLPLPFHPNALPAAVAAEGVRATAGNDAFWRFYASAFGAQETLGPDAYAAWAKAAGATAATITKGNPAWNAKVDRDVEQAKKLGVDGTPTFLVNGEIVPGAQPVDVFEQVIAQELTKAKALVAQGTSPDRVYTTLTTSNLKEQAAEAAKEAAEAEKPDTNVYKVPVGKSPVLGAKDAPLTIVEFSDFQCPYCKRAEDALKSVRAKYGQDVRLVWKNEPLPFHDRAEPAAELALEARAEKGDAGFWAAHDALFESQPKLADADLEAVAASLKLDVAKVKQAIKTHKYQREIDEDTLLGDGFAADGTPHFFVDGHRVVGAQPLEAFTAILDADLAKAHELAAKGTPAKGIYDALTKDGLAEITPPKKEAPAPAANAPARGAAGAKVVVQEFADFQCPFCEKVEKSIDELVKQYPNKVRVVWRNTPLPMHPDAQLAAEAALEAKAQKGDAGFWKMHDLLFANQRTDGGLQRQALDGYARQLGLDMTKWGAALDGHAHSAAIDADKDAAKVAELNSTPSFLINGYVVSGAQPYSKFRLLVERALAESSKPAPAGATPGKGAK